MPRTVWYPGHMAKGKRQLEDFAQNLEMLIEVRDARAPHLTSSPMIETFAKKLPVITVLSKADLADAESTKMWCNYIKGTGHDVWALDLKQGGITQLAKHLQKSMPTFRDLRIAVFGIPNVGKSMLINKLVGRYAVKVGGIPGVTKGVSWVKGNGFLLVDSPGILDPHSDARAHRLISWLGSSRSDVIDSYEEHAKELISFLCKKNILHNFAPLLKVEVDGEPYELLEKIASRYGKLLPGGLYDIEAAAKLFLEGFANGKWGKFTLELPKDEPLWTMLLKI